MAEPTTYARPEVTPDPAMIYPLALRRAWIVQDMEWQLERLSKFGVECDKAGAAELSDARADASKFLRLAIASLKPETEGK